MAEWLRNGLQNRVPRFNSGRGLHDFRMSAGPGAMRPTRSGVIRPARPGVSTGAARGDTIGAAGCDTTDAAVSTRISRFSSADAFVIRGPVRLPPFPGSSAVEQPAVNRLVAGSNPARGANKSKVYEGPLGPLNLPGYGRGTRRLFVASARSGLLFFRVHNPNCPSPRVSTQRRATIQDCGREKAGES